VGSCCSDQTFFWTLRWFDPCFVGPCHHSKACPRVADGRDGLQVWRVAPFILNKWPQTADKGWSSSFGVGRRASNSTP
jgi:hypothetical protein